MSAPDRVEIKYPEYPMSNHQESYYQSRQTLGHQSSTIHSFTITKDMHINQSKFCVAIDTEKIIEAGFSVLNTRAGDLLTVKCKYITPAAGGALAATRSAQLMHIVLRSDHIREIRDTRVSVFDQLMIKYVIHMFCLTY